MPQPPYPRASVRSTLLAFVLALLCVCFVAACTSDDGSVGDGGSDGIGGNVGHAGTGGAGAATGGGGHGGDAGVGGAGGDAGGAGSGAIGGAGAGGDDGSGDATSIDAIEAALEAGDITEVDALRYKVFAVFGDARLPEAYRSESPLKTGTPVLIELAERFDTLPTSVQEELDPFFRAPSDPLSWHQLGQTSEVAPKDVNPRFDYIEAIDGKVLIQWPKQSGELREDAERVVAALSGPDGVWAKLTTLMGREPISDDGIIEKYNGGDERFDIYIVKDLNVVTRDLQTSFGWTSPYRAGADGNKRAAYLVMNRDRIATAASGLELKIKSNLAHEFMHVLQFAYDVAESRSAYLWVMESTATWAEHFVFPDDDVEHEDADDYLRKPEFSLTSLSGNHMYGAYLYWFFLTERPGGSDDIIADLFTAAESMSPLEAANSVSPGGFDGTFADFAVANWNRAPFNAPGNTPYDVYVADGMTETARRRVKFSSPSPDEVIDVPFTFSGIPRLAAQYVLFRLNFGDIGSILFANGWTFELQEGVPNALSTSGTESVYATRLDPEDAQGRKVLALIKQNGVWRDQPFDLTNVAFAPFCQQADSESVEDLVLIFINDDHREGPFFKMSKGLPSRVLTSNAGCGDWVGSGGAIDTVLEPNRTQTAVLDIESIAFRRETLTLDQIAAGEGQTVSVGEYLPPNQLRGLSGFPGDDYELTELTATWTFEEDSTDPGSACSGTGSGGFTKDDLAAPPEFRVGPYLHPISGGTNVSQLYRSFFYELFYVAPGEPVSGTCVSNGQPSAYTRGFEIFIAGGFRDTPAYGMRLLEPNGKDINQLWTVDTTDIDLRLTSEPIP